MQFIWEQLTDVENWNFWLNEYAGFGPLPGIILPFSEAILPFLPLFAIVAGNAMAYGLWWGYLFSWIGTTLGSIFIFYFFRLLRQRRMDRFFTRYPKAERFSNWIGEKGFTPLFLLYSFPFTPSSLVNIAAGISTVPLRVYVVATALGKGIMVFIMSFVGHDILHLWREPWKLLLLGALIALMWFGGKLVEKRYIKAFSKSTKR